MERERIIAIGLLTETNVRMLGSSLKKVFPIPEDGRFDALLQALDEEDRERTRTASGTANPTD
ncbi:hypothetical protein [Altericroceibacterium xinjiangense]|uniref:hypothetical protein n=1 Tax=Altericroceibacterium xinjiangense TaxID=762261 RepID=UPI000F7F860E|nr:hypothetical protein [Altericroceibacterium xinjiangense]